MIPDNVLRTALEAVTGEPPVLVGDMHYDLQQPCGDCPFLKSSPYHQGVAKSLPTYIDAIKSGSFGHSCHKTDPRLACDGPHPTDGRPVQHCVGAILMVMKSGKYWMQRPLIKAHDDGKIDLLEWERRAKLDDRVFTWRGMIRFYIDELSKCRTEAAK
jgi:hypothetical protein